MAYLSVNKNAAPIKQVLNKEAKHNLWVQQVGIANSSTRRSIDTHKYEKI